MACKIHEVKYMYICEGDACCNIKDSALYDVAYYDSAMTVAISSPTIGDGTVDRSVVSLE